MQRLGGKAPLSQRAVELIQFACSDGRVCPQPQLWNVFWEQLPEKRREGAGWIPSLPLLLGAWWIASDSDKAECFRKHIEWADAHGNIGKADQFLRALSAEQWHMVKQRIDC